MFQSDLYVDFNEAVMQGSGVAQQQRSSVFLGLVQEGVDKAGDANEAQSFPAACGQGEVTLRDPAQSHSGAVWGDARQRIRPQPQDEIRGWVRGGFGVFFWPFALRLVRGRGGGRCFLGGALLSALHSGFKVIFVRRLLGAVWLFAQQLQVVCVRHTHHGVQLRFALGHQRQTHPHQTHAVLREEGRRRRGVERRHVPDRTKPLTFRCGGSAPAREQLQRLSVPAKAKTNNRLREMIKSHILIRRPEHFWIPNTEDKKSADGQWKSIQFFPHKVSHYSELVWWLYENRCNSSPLLISVMYCSNLRLDVLWGISSGTLWWKGGRLEKCHASSLSNTAAPRSLKKKKKEQRSKWWLESKAAQTLHTSAQETIKSQQF